MPQTTLLIGIVSCQKNILLHHHLRQTWLSQMRPDIVKHLFIIGRPGQPDHVKGSELYLDCDDSYEKLPQKVIRFLKYANKNLNFDYLLKCDDDSYVSQGVEDIPNKYPGDFITGRLLPHSETGYRRWLTSKDLMWHPSYERFLDGLKAFPCGGEGYFLSRRAVQLAINAEEENKDVFLPASEDIVVTQLLARKGISPTLVMHMSTQPTELCKRWLSLRPDPSLIVHPVPPRAMKFFMNRTLLWNKAAIIVQAISSRILRYL